MDMSWDDHLTEESLFYAVPSGAMEAYRKSIVSHVMQCEKTGNSLQEEVETSMYHAVAEFGYYESAYDEDEGETKVHIICLDLLKVARHQNLLKRNEIA
ncbi:chromatin modification-related protein EAF1 B-like [Tripterygium wilfordii]|uniref:chromatin modification-related protein EAF1 B-like n=1 Tax=Tripterygium wilfordii TaxID=458696 RepID=UPI0018F839B5|nr:chromatin modification-related protein EAF1 B-like [Tripterygium wilfordii]